MEGVLVAESWKWIYVEGRKEPEDVSEHNVEGE
jgi:hypothetical protein